MSCNCKAHEVEFEHTNYKAHLGVHGAYTRYDSYKEVHALAINQATDDDDSDYDGRLSREKNPMLRILELKVDS